jgi:tetratricopeptide (TPR) repeat protein
LDQVQNLQKTVADAGRAPSLNAQGLDFLKAGQLENAEGAFRGALRVDPLFAIAAHNLGVTLFRQGRDMEAIEAFRTAIRVNPTFAAAHSEAELLKRFTPQHGEIVPGSLP